MRLAAVVLDGRFENEPLNAQWTVTKLDGDGDDAGEPLRIAQHVSALSFGRALAAVLNPEFIDESNQPRKLVPNENH
jgi:hypothetical protein